MSSVGGIFQCPDGTNPAEMQIWNNAAFDNGEPDMDSEETVLRPSSWWSSSLESNSSKENLSPVLESASTVSNPIKSSVSSMPIKPLQSKNVFLSNLRDTQMKDLGKEGLSVSKKDKDPIDMEIEEIEKEIGRLSSRLEALRLAKQEKSIIKSIEKPGRMVAAKFMEPQKQCVKIEEPIISCAKPKINRRGMSLGPAEIFSGAKSRLLTSKQEMITPVSTQNRRKSCFWKLGEIDELRVAKERGKSLSVSPRSRKNAPNIQPPKQAVTTIGSKRPVKKEDGIVASIQPKMLFKDGEKSVPTVKKVKPGRIVASRYNQIATNQSNGSFSEARKRSWPENDKEDVSKRRASRGNGASAVRMESGRVKKKWEIPSEVVVYKDDALMEGDSPPPPTVSIVVDELPKIRTNRYVTETPRDSGPAKRVADLAGRKTYFCIDEENAAEDSVCMSLSFAEEEEEVKEGGGGLLVFSYGNPFESIDPSQNDGKKKKVVVLGTGWAGTSFLKNLKSSNYDVQVVSPRNHFTFTPLLPSVTNGTVEARSIVEPIRNIVRKKPYNVEFKEAECYQIDPEQKKIYCRSNQTSSLNGTKEFEVDYDILVLAMGARVNTFNTPGVEEHAHFLKEVNDAQKLRRSIIDCYERANLPSVTEEEKKQIMNFVVVGGGPTGVEYAAELHDLAFDDLAKLYPSVKDYLKITLLEAGDHILNMFDKRIATFAAEKFQRDGIEVKTGSLVTKVSDKDISTKLVKTGETISIPYGVVLWSTGIATRPVIKDFMNRKGQANRRVLATDEWLRVEGCHNIYALGDCTTINQRKVMEDISIIFSKADTNNTGTLDLKDFKQVVSHICERYPQVELYLQKKKLKSFDALLKNAQGDEKKQIDIETFKKALLEVDAQMKNLPATAQVAAQQGEYLARCFNRMQICEKNPEGPIRFRGTGRHRYKHFGQFAPLGGEQAAVQLPGDFVSIGHSSQWLWYSVYASKLVSWRTRMLVISDWSKRFIFGRDSSQI